MHFRTYRIGTGSRLIRGQSMLKVVKSTDKVAETVLPNKTISTNDNKKLEKPEKDIEKNKILKGRPKTFKILK